MRVLSDAKQMEQHFDVGYVILLKLCLITPHFQGPLTCKQVEEQRLTQAQSAAAEAPLISVSKKKRGKKDAGTPLPTQNGEGDSLSINSGILLVISASWPPAATTALDFHILYVMLSESY